MRWHAGVAPCGFYPCMNIRSVPAPLRVVGEVWVARGLHGQLILQLRRHSCWFTALAGACLAGWKTATIASQGSGFKAAVRYRHSWVGSAYIVASTPT